MGLRERVAGKARRQTTYPLPVGSREEIEGAQRALSSSQMQLGMVQARHSDDPDHPAVAEAQRRVDERQAALDGFHVLLVFQSMAVEDFDELVTADAGLSREQRKERLWTKDMFEVKVVAASAVDSDMTAEDWAAELSKPTWALDERWGVVNEALAANNRRVRDLRGLGNG